MDDPIRQQLITARRHQILDAAAAVFAERGFHAATIRDIATRAGIADGTIYNYFENKSALLLGIMDRMQETVLREEAEPVAAPEDLRAFLSALLRHPLMALRDDDFQLFRVLISEIMVDEELRALYFERVVEPAVTLASAHLRGSLGGQDAELLVRVVSGLVMGLILQNVMGDRVLEQQWDALPAYLADLLVDGIKGRPES